MKELLIKILILVLPLMFIQTGEDSTINETGSVTVLNVKPEYKAGEKISLSFEGTLSDPVLLWDSGYGSTVFKATQNNELINFEIPSEISDSKGLVKWTLIDGSDPVEHGEFRIQAARKIEEIEVYTGPTDLFAGGDDEAMIVVIPMDELGNTVVDSSEVELKTNFIGISEQETLFVKDNFTYKRITSPDLSGRMTFSLQSPHSNAKEIIVDINPGLPDNFNISYEQAHSYADGNELTSIVTSVITDKKGNMISDGTMVHFIVKKEDGLPLSANGQTIGGIARAEILHPEKAEIYSIQAQVDGLAKSNTIELNFNQAVEDFQIEWNENEKELRVGPVLSYMGQWIPDGFGIKLTIIYEGVPVKTIHGQSLKGYSGFILKNLDISRGVYDLEIEAAGLIKRINKVEL